jgi:hypothetical protein
MKKFPFKTIEHNILDEWVKRMRLLNSNLASKRLIRVENQAIYDVKSEFISCFGEEFFISKTIKVISPHTKSRDSEWIYQILCNNGYPTIMQAFETAYILGKMRCLLPDQHKILNRTKKTQTFRNYLFEAIVYDLLDRNNVSYDPKPVIKGREKEGTLILGNKTFLFECKKLFSFQIPEIDFLFWIQQDFLSVWKKYAIGMNVHIWIQEGTEDELKRVREAFKSCFEKYFDALKAGGELHVKYPVMIKDSLVGELIVDPPNFGLYIHQRELLKSPSVSLQVQNPHPEMIENQVKYLFPTHYNFKIEQLETKSMDHFIYLLHKKRTSQSDMKHMPRIFFFDNEVYNGMEPPLFFGGNIYNEQPIIDYVNRKDTDDIICILLRKYNLQQKPSWELKVYCKEHLAKYKQEILAWDLLYRGSEPRFKAPELVF